MLEAIIIAALTVQSTPNESTQPPSSDVEPSAHVYNILHAADEATKNVRSVKYDAVREGTGSMATRVPLVEGSVILSKTDRRSANTRLEGTVYSVRELQGTVSTFLGVVNGDDIRRIDHERKLVIRGGGGLRSLGSGVGIILAEFNSPVPFQDEIESARSTLEGQQTRKAQENSTE